MWNSVTTWVTFDIVLFLALLIPLFLSLRLCHNSPFTVPLKHYHLFFILGILIYCLFDKASGDYFHYEEIIEEMSVLNSAGHLEPVYLFFARTVDFNYFLFRLIVWGGSLFFWVKCVRLVQLREDVVYSMFILFTLTIFSYARVSLAITIFLFGYILLITSSQRTRRNKIFIRVLGLALIIVSTFFHKSVFVLILLTPFSFIRLSRKWIIISVILFPIFVYAVNLFADKLLLANLDFAGANYLHKEKLEDGLGGMLNKVLLNIGLTLLFIRLIYFFSFKKNLFIPKYINRLYSLSYMIFYLASVLSFLSIGSSAISYRVKNMAFFPLIFVITYYVTNLEKKKIYPFLSILFVFISDVYYLLYMLYWKYIGNY